MTGQHEVKDGKDKFITNRDQISSNFHKKLRNDSFDIFFLISDDEFQEIGWFKGQYYH